MANYGGYYEFDSTMDYFALGPADYAHEVSIVPTGEAVSGTPRFLRLIEDWRAESSAEPS
jgi:hypothetical protein